MVTILAVVLCFFMSFRVATMRAKHKIMAPTCTGNPEFERAFRVHYNTIENLIVFLPLLWIASLFFDATIAAGVGIVWVLSRIVYMQLYMANPEGRTPGALVGLLCLLGLLIMSVWGLAFP